MALGLTDREKAYLEDKKNYNPNYGYRLKFSIKQKIETFIQDLTTIAETNPTLIKKQQTKNLHKTLHGLLNTNNNTHYKYKKQKHTKLKEKNKK